MNSQKALHFTIFHNKFHLSLLVVINFHHTADYSVIRYSSIMNSNQSDSQATEQTEVPTYSKKRRSHQNSILLEEPVKLQDPLAALAPVTPPLPPEHPTTQLTFESLCSSMKLNGPTADPAIDHMKVSTVKALASTLKIPHDSQEDNRSTSSTYSMAGRCEDDGSISSVHYSAISSHEDKVSDIYSLANSTGDDHEPADYEDFYSVPRDGVCKDDGNGHKNVVCAGNRPFQATATNHSMPALDGEGECILQHQQEQRHPQVTNKGKKIPVPCPAASQSQNESRPRSMSYIEPQKTNLPTHSATSNSFRSKQQNTNVHVN